MVSKEMMIGAFWAFIVLILAYFFFEFLFLAAKPFNWLGNFLL